MKSGFTLAKLRPVATLVSLLRNNRGNMGISFALLLVPMILAVGVSIDFVRAYDIQAKMQTDLDAALIAAVKDVGNLNEAEVQKKVQTWFDAQTDIDASKYSLSDSDIKISKTNKTIQAVATAGVPTTFMEIADIHSVNVSATSSVAGPATSYMNVYLVLDKSASMLLAATAAGQSSLRNTASCEFACHTADGSTYKYNGKSYGTVYQVAKAMGITLRADVSVEAVDEVLDMIDDANASSSHIKVGLYTIGASATQVLAPTYSTSTARSYLKDDSEGLNSATSETVSYFDASLPTLATLVGSAGDGSSASSPLKLVLLLTDGVESTRDWVTNNPKNTWKCTQSSGSTCVYYNSKYFPMQPKVSPLNPKWCDAMKGKTVTVGVLYTEYLAAPLDWGYNMTVGETMKTSGFTSTWGGTMRSGVSATTTRRDYVPYALKDCASSEDLFISASDAGDIKSGLSSLFEQYLTSVRLTQ